MGISWIIMRYNPPVGNRKAYEQLYLFYQPTMVCGTFHDRLMTKLGVRFIWLPTWLPGVTPAGPQPQVAPSWPCSLVCVSARCDRRTCAWLSHHTPVRDPSVSHVAPSWACTFGQWIPRVFFPCNQLVTGYRHQRPTNMHDAPGRPLRDCSPRTRYLLTAGNDQL